MKITLAPNETGHINPGHNTAISVDGLTVTVDGIAHDLSVIPENGQAEAEDDGPFIGLVTRDEVTVKYHYDSSTAEPNQSPDIADYTFEVTAGEVPSPIVRKPEPEEIDDVV